MTKEQVLLEVFKMTVVNFCFSIWPVVFAGALLAWIMPAPKTGQSGNVVINVSQDNGGTK